MFFIFFLIVIIFVKFFKLVFKFFFELLVLLVFIIIVIFVVGDHDEMNRVRLRDFQLRVALRAGDNLSFFHFIFVQIDFSVAFRAGGHSLLSVGAAFGLAIGSRTCQNPAGSAIAISVQIIATTCADLQRRLGLRRPRADTYKDGEYFGLGENGGRRGRHGVRS